MKNKKLPNVHPGEVILEDFLKPTGITVEQLAEALGYTLGVVQEIVNGKRAVNARVALALERCLGFSARFWMHLQASYDLEEEKRVDDPFLKRVKPLLPKVTI